MPDGGDRPAAGDPGPPDRAADLAAYLGEHAPFGAMPADSLLALGAAATEHTFRTGELIVDYLTGTPDEIWVVRSGSVALLGNRDTAGEPVDVVGPGGVFGYLALLSEGAVAFLALAGERTVAIRLPGAMVRSLFTDPSGLQYLATTAWDTIATRAPADRASTVAVGAHVPRWPVFTAPDTSIRDAVRHMTDEHVSYTLVRDGSGRTVGIFTDRDLRTRVVAADCGLDQPISAVMSGPVQTVPADRIAATVLMDMLESGLRHMPVVDRRGAVLGVVEERDLVATSARQSFVVRRAIALAADTAELRAAFDRVDDLVVNLFRGGTDASGTSAVLSVMVDATVARALELELAERPQPWVRQFAWLTLGSVARREAMPSSDVDSAISWADDAELDPGQVRAMAARVQATLDECGLPSDTNGAVASSPRFSRSAGDWHRAAQDWLADPMSDRGLIMSSLLLDARVVHGNPALNSAPAAFSRMSINHPNALRLQLLDALSGKPRVRSLRDIVARRGGTFDLKNHALSPIVNLSRWAGLTAGLGVATTPERLDAAVAQGALAERDARILAEVFAMVQRLRLSHQIDQLSAGQPPSDIVTMSQLSPLSRSLLTDGMREVAAVQRRVRHQATMGVRP
nr:putative nucleotidyltransferase substrate binding domain-containing protein [Jongsikchunia kroppenstedtii]